MQDALLKEALVLVKFKVDEDEIALGSIWVRIISRICSIRTDFPERRMPVRTLMTSNPTNGLTFSRKSNL